MQASGYTGLHPLQGTDEGSGLVVIDNCYHTYVAVDSPVTNVHSASFIVLNSRSILWAFVLPGSSVSSKSPFLNLSFDPLNCEYGDFSILMRGIPH
jgi:hypothetical protein